MALWFTRTHIIKKLTSDHVGIRCTLASHLKIEFSTSKKGEYSCHYARHLNSFCRVVSQCCLRKSRVLNLKTCLGTGYEILPLIQYASYVVDSDSNLWASKFIALICWRFSQLGNYMRSINNECSFFSLKWALALFDDMQSKWKVKPLSQLIQIPVIFCY